VGGGRRSWRRRGENETGRGWIGDRDGGGGLDGEEAGRSCASARSLASPAAPPLLFPTLPSAQGPQ
jgi:hypothetical protein